MQFLSTLAGRAIAILAVVLLIVGAVALSQCQSARNARTEAGLSDNQTEAVTQSAKDAIGTVGAVAGRDAAGDDITRSNDDAIRNAPGADAPVDPRASGAGLDSLCKRPAYRGSEQCLQRAPAP